MKHHSKFHSISRVLPKESSVDIADCTERFRSLSFYFKGGVDLTGDALLTNGDAEYDTEEDASDILSEGASSVAFGDPKMSKFRIVEQLGAKAGQDALAKEQLKGSSSDLTE